MRPSRSLAPFDGLLRAVRAPGPWLRVGVPVGIVLVFALYLTVAWPWMLTWGATPADQARVLPGDDLVPNATHQSTRVVTVRAPAEESWRWLVQIGEDRAGFYSYDWLENLVGADIHNVDVVRAEWQTLRAGDLVRAVPDNYLGGVLEMPGWRVAAIEEGKWFVLERWGAFVVEPVDATSSRVLVRTRFSDDTWWGPVITKLAFGPVHFVMERRMLLGLRDRAEGRAPRFADVLARIGFAAAAAAVGLLFLHRRRGRGWLAIPVLLLAAVLAETGDGRAAVAGFVALGLVMLALPHLRAVWPVLLPVPVVVLLVLLLASDAYIVSGIGFLAIAMISLGIGLTNRAPRAVPLPAAAPSTRS